MSVFRPSFLYSLLFCILVFFYLSYPQSKDTLPLKVAITKYAAKPLPENIKKVTISLRLLEKEGHFGAMEALFKKYPDLELVIDLGNEERAHDHFGYYNPSYEELDVYALFPDTLRKLTIKGKKMKVIGNYFLNDYKNIVSVTLPKGIEVIEDNFLSGCLGVTSVAIPDGVKTLGSEFLSGCTNLKSVTVPNSVQKVGREFLFGCEKLESANISESVRKLLEIDSNILIQKSLHVH